MLRAVLLDRQLGQDKRRKILPELVFAQNCSESSAIKCVSYNVVFGRTPTLPLDVIFGLKSATKLDCVTPREYSEEISPHLKNVFDHVVKYLKLSKMKKQKQYSQI